jgi:hypothetical protein
MTALLHTCQAEQTTDPSKIQIPPANAHPQTAPLQRGFDFTQMDIEPTTYKYVLSQRFAMNRSRLPFPIFSESTLGSFYITEKTRDGRTTNKAARRRRLQTPSSVRVICGEQSPVVTRQSEPAPLISYLLSLISYLLSLSS